MKIEKRSRERTRKPERERTRKPAADGKRPRFAKLLEAAEKPPNDSPRNKMIGEKLEGSYPPVERGLTAFANSGDNVTAKSAQVFKQSQQLFSARKSDEQQLAETGAAFASDGSLDDRVLSERPVEISATKRVQQTNAESPAQVAGARSGEVEELMTRLVEKVQASEEARRRKTVVLHLDAGKEGKVTVRLRREGDGFDLRMRPSDPEFAGRLHERQGDLRRAAAKRGLRFTQIDVVR